MLRIVLAFAIFFTSSPVFADVLTRQEYFELYAQIIPRTLIAQRMEQMFGMIPVGADRTQAKSILRQDLLDQIQVNLDGFNEMYINPTTQQQTDVGDTDL